MQKGQPSAFQSALPRTQTKEKLLVSLQSFDSEDSDIEKELDSLLRSEKNALLKSARDAWQLAAAELIRYENANKEHDFKGPFSTNVMWAQVILDACIKNYLSLSKQIETTSLLTSVSPPPTTPIEIQDSRPSSDKPPSRSDTAADRHIVLIKNLLLATENQVRGFGGVEYIDDRGDVGIYPKNAAAMLTILDQFGHDLETCKAMLRDYFAENLLDDYNQLTSGFFRKESTTECYNHVWMLCQSPRIEHIAPRHNIQSAFFNHGKDEISDWISSPGSPG